MAARTGVAELLDASGEGALSPVEGLRAFRSELAHRLMSAGEDVVALEAVVRAGPARPCRAI